MNSSVTILQASSLSQPGRMNSCLGGAGGGEVEGERGTCALVLWLATVFGVRMNSSSTSGGEDGGEGSTFRRFTVAAAFGLRSAGAGFASHGNVRGISAIHSESGKTR